MHYKMWRPATTKNSGTGRVVSYKIGDVIMRSEPWIFSLRWKYISEHCYRCVQRLVKDKWKKCRGCGFVRYCSRECQTRDKKDRHFLECQSLKMALFNAETDSNTTDLLLVFFKVIIKLAKDNETNIPNQRDPSTCRSFHDLLSHEVELMQSPAALTLCTTLYTKWTPYFRLIDHCGKMIPSLDAFISIYGKIQINSFSIMTPFRLGMNQKPIGTGIYLGPSIFDHSCDASATQLFDGVTLIIKAIQPIASLDDVRISYVSAWDTVHQRQRSLEKYYFRCSCCFCTDRALIAQRHAIKCPTPACHFPIGLDRESSSAGCGQCQRKLRDGEMTAARMTINILKESYEMLRVEDCNVQTSEGRKTRLVKLRKLTTLGEQLLHPTNFLLGLLYCFSAPLLLEFEAKEEAYNCISKGLVPMRTHLNLHDPALLNYIGRMTLWSLEFAPLSDVDYYAAELLTTLLVPYGRKSQEYRTVKKLLKSCEVVTDLVN